MATTHRATHRSGGGEDRHQLHGAAATDGTTTMCVVVDWWTRRTVLEMPGLMVSMAKGCAGDQPAVGAGPGGDGRWCRVVAGGGGQRWGRVRREPVGSLLITYCPVAAGDSAGDYVAKIDGDTMTCRLECAFFRFYQRGDSTPTAVHAGVHLSNAVLLPRRRPEAAAKP
ncbi:hypothetical protein ABZP36_011604 [Zizania latifolia]